MGEYADIKDRIKYLRTAHGLSQADLADKLGVDKVAVSQWERGVRQPKLEARQAMCDIFNVNMEYLNGNWNKISRLVDEQEMLALDAGRLSSASLPHTLAAHFDGDEDRSKKRLTLLSRILDLSHHTPPDIIRSSIAQLERAFDNPQTLEENGRSKQWNYVISDENVKQIVLGALFAPMDVVKNIFDLMNTVDDRQPLNDTIADPDNVKLGKDDIEIKIASSPLPRTLAAHFDGDEFTEDEIGEIRQFVEFIKSKRGNKIFL